MLRELSCYRWSRKLQTQSKHSLFLKSCIILATIIGGILQGCVVSKVQDIDVISSKNKTAITDHVQEKQTILMIPGTTRRDSASRGGKMCGITGASAGVLCLWGAPLCIPAFGVLGAVGGATYGALIADSPDDWKKRNELFTNIIKDADIGKKIIEKTVNYSDTLGIKIISDKEFDKAEEKTENYSYFLNHDISTLIELKKISVSLSEEDNYIEIIPKREFILKIYISIKDIINNKEIDRIIYDKLGGIYDISEWEMDNGIIFKKELENSISRISENLVTDCFFLHKTSEIIQYGFIYNVVVTGLKAYNPWLRNEMEINKPIISPSRKPTLSWSAFRGDGAETSYDLKIWQANGKFPGDLIYHKENLQSTSHTVESELAAHTKYFWSVRAHFFDGTGPRVTEWSRYTIKPSELMTIFTLGLIRIPAYPYVDANYDFTTAQ